MSKVVGMLRGFLLLDLFGDQRVRPILAYSLFLLVLGTLVFHSLEAWTWVDSFYFSAITLLTIGYGDLTPTTDLTKVIVVLYAFNGVGVIVAFASQALQVRAERRGKLGSSPPPPRRQ